MLYEQVKKMLGPPSWKSDVINLKEAPTEPQTLYWQDLVESMHFLFQNPEFDGNMAYAPSRLYQQDDTRVYSEMTMGEEWHYQQVCPSPNLLKSHNMIRFIKACLANGSTILGIILVSDHTHLTNFTGDKKMHLSISALKEVQRRFPSASLYEFKQQVKRLGKGLSGMIEEPCWAGLGIDPSVFIKQDILHGLHKFIWDHPGEWLKKLIGENKMDRHFIVQPPIHTQHFTGGISKISQASGWEHCAYQRLMLPIIFGHEKVDAKVINAIWSVLDFVYMAQYPLLSDSNLSKMKDLLSSFNRNKEVFISNGS